MKNIDDFRKDFFRITEEGRKVSKIKGPMLASMEASVKMRHLLENDYSHIKDECGELIADETISLLRKQERERKEILEKVFDDVISKMAEGCEDPSCEVCSNEKRKSEEAEQLKNGFTKSPNVPGNGSVH